MRQNPLALSPTPECGRELPVVQAPLQDRWDKLPMVSDGFDTGTGRNRRTVEQLLDSLG